MPAFRLYNTLTRAVEPFAPSDGKTVRMYTCGPTVYDPAHVGNFRTFLFNDLLRRYLKFRGFKVDHAMNITDVEDKIIAGANGEGTTLQEYTGRYTAIFLEDLKYLNFGSDRFLNPPYSVIATTKRPSSDNTYQGLPRLRLGSVRLRQRARHSSCVDN